jgi:16S rRNA G966 N2-methylase RsmD
MKNPFYMPYAGNKRTEAEKIYSSILSYDNIETIVEPFCGSCSFSYYCSIQNKDKKFKYVLNDSNGFLKEMYDTMIDKKKTKAFEAEFANVVESFTDNKDKYNEIVKTQNNLMSWFIANKIYNLRPGMYPINRPYKKTIKLSETPIYNFYNNEDITFITGCGVICYEKYKTDPTALIFLDPPYLNSCNDFYLDTTFSKTNIYEHLLDNNIANENSIIILCLENIWIMKLLFKNNIINDAYDKTYAPSKKKTSHIIIKNKLC